MKTRWLISVIVILIFLIGCTEKTIINSIKKLNKGDTLIEDFMEMNIMDTTIQNKVEPKTASGYYHYFEEKEGYTYFCIEGSLKNIGNEILDVENIEALLVLDGKEVVGRMRLYKEDGSDLITDIQAEENLSYIIFFQVEMKEKIEPESMILQYEDSLRKRNDEKNIRYQTVWQL